MDLKELPPEVVRRHPWEVARARSYRALVAAHTDIRAVRRVLDAGAGDGWFATDVSQVLHPSAEILCWDINYRSTDVATPIGPRIARTADRPDGVFDLVFVLDVLEHIEEDESFLASTIVPAIAPGALVLLSVPAHPRLFSDHDRMLEHCRRYRPADFRALVGRHLDVVASGSVFTSLVPLRAVDVLRQRLGRRGEQRGVGAWSAGPVVTWAMTSLLTADAALGRGSASMGLPLPGLSTWAVARRVR